MAARAENRKLRSLTAENPEGCKELEKLLCSGIIVWEAGEFQEPLAFTTAETAV